MPGAYLFIRCGKLRQRAKAGDPAAAQGLQGKGPPRRLQRGARLSRLAACRHATSSASTAGTSLCLHGAPATPHNLTGAADPVRRWAQAKAASPPPRASTTRNAPPYSWPVVPSGAWGHARTSGGSTNRRLTNTAAQQAARHHMPLSRRYRRIQLGPPSCTPEASRVSPAGTRGLQQCTTDQGRAGS